jgi:hypothetical protein
VHGLLEGGSVDSSLAARELGFPAQPLGETLADHIRGLLQRGPIASTHAGLLAPSA